MKFNIKDVQLKDLDGNEIVSDLGKALGNLIYKFSSTIEWLDLARAIHSGAPAEVTEHDLAELKQFIKGSQLTLLVKDPLIRYIDSLKQ